MIKTRKGLPTKKSLMELAEHHKLSIPEPMLYEGKWIQITWSGYLRDGDARATEIAAHLLGLDFDCHLTPSNKAMGRTGQLRIYKGKQA